MLMFFFKRKQNPRAVFKGWQGMCVWYTKMTINCAYSIFKLWFTIANSIQVVTDKTRRIFKKFGLYKLLEAFLLKLANMIFWHIKGMLNSTSPVHKQNFKCLPISLA